jgi:hypothetical protein
MRGIENEKEIGGGPKSKEKMQRAGSWRNPKVASPGKGAEQRQRAKGKRK